MNKKKIKIWIQAARPKTLAAAVAPVLIGTAMAFGDGVGHFFTALVCLTAALAIQIGTNLSNDYYDHKKGTDTIERIGPQRMTQSGAIKPKVMRKAYRIAFLTAAVLSLWLIYRGGWPILIIGILSILSGFFYTAGPVPLGYVGLGDLFVLVFFGPVAVAGTYYVQSLEMNAAVIMAGIAPGLISVAILTVNNLRDIDSDKKTGKRTLAVRFGRSFSVNEYLFSIISAALIPVFLYWYMQDHLPILACTLLLFIAVPVIKTVCEKTDGPTLNEALAKTGRLLMIYSILFSIGWVL